MSCLGFVFAALIEFAGVLLLSDMLKNEEKAGMEDACKFTIRKSNSSYTVTNNIVKPANTAIDTNKGEQNCQPQMNPKRIDNIACLIFSGSFIIFNLAYWIYYHTYFNAIVK